MDNSKDEEIDKLKRQLATCVEALERVRVLCRNAGFPMVRTDFIAPIIAEALAKIEESK